MGTLSAVSMADSTIVLLVMRQAGGQGSKGPVAGEGLSGAHASERGTVPPLCDAHMNCLPLWTVRSIPKTPCIAL